MAKLNKEQIAAELAQANLTYLHGEYKNLDSLLTCHCENDHEILVSIKKVRKGFECMTCKELASAIEDEHKFDALQSKKSKRILGLDQSSTIIGYAVVEDNRLITYGIHEEKNSDITHRLMKHKQWLKSILDVWDIDEVVLEDVYGGQNIKTTIALAEVLGVLKIAAYEQLGNKPTIVPAVTWKSFCGVKGKARQAQKENTQKYIKDKFGIIASFDCADAICIATYGNYLLSFEKEIRFD